MMSKYSRTIYLAENELYKFWNTLPDSILVGNVFNIEDILMLALKNNFVKKDGIIYLYKLTKQYKKAKIHNVGGQPVLHIKLKD